MFFLTPWVFIRSRVSLLIALRHGARHCFSASFFSRALFAITTDRLGGLTCLDYRPNNARTIPPKCYSGVWDAIGLNVWLSAWAPDYVQQWTTTTEHCITNTNTCSVIPSHRLICRRVLRSQRRLQTQLIYLWVRYRRLLREWTRHIIVSILRMHKRHTRRFTVQTTESNTHQIHSGAPPGFMSLSHIIQFIYICCFCWWIGHFLHFWRSVLITSNRQIFDELHQRIAINICHKTSSCSLPFFCTN